MFIQRDWHMGQAVMIHIISLFGISAGEEKKNYLSKLPFMSLKV